MAILYEFQQTITNRLHLASYGVGGNQKLKKKKFRHKNNDDNNEI